MRRLAAILVAGSLLLPLSSCKRKQSAAAPPPSVTPEGFEEILSSVLPRLSKDGRAFRDPEVERMLEQACSAPRRFDRLLDHVSEATDPTLSTHLFGYANMGKKDCLLGEDYSAALVDRLLKEGNAKRRKVIRESIQWHVFHEHARKWSPKPFEESVSARVRAFSRRDSEDDRWYGVVQAIYAPRFPEAAAEMWRAIREDAEKTDGLLAVGAFETSFNRMREGSWRYREQFLKECLIFVKQARDQENPWAAGWMIKRQFLRFAMQGPNLHPGEVFEWEAAFHDSASRGKSQVHRGDAILALIALESPRAVPALNAWLQQPLTDSVIHGFLRELPISNSGREEVLLSEVTHPRVRARLTVRRELRERSWERDGTAVAYLLETLKTNPDPEMRREAVHDLAYTLRDDDRDANEGLPQGMSNRLDLLEIVLADPSRQVRMVLADALKRQEKYFFELDSNRRTQIRKLFDSVK